MPILEYLMLLDDDLKPAPVRVLKLNGEFTPEATPDIVAKYSQPKRMTEQEMSYPQNFVGLSSFPKKQAPDAPRLPIVPRPESAYRRAAAVRVWGAGVVVRKVKDYSPPRQRISKGPWVSWNKIDGMTVEAIHDLQAKGMLVREIATHFNCTQAAVFKRLRLARRESAREAEKDAALKTCACGRPKWAARTICAYCAKPKRPSRGTPCPKCGGEKRKRNDVCCYCAGTKKRRALTVLEATEAK